MLSFEDFCTAVGLQADSMSAASDLHYSELRLFAHALLDPNYASKDYGVTSVQFVAEKFIDFTNDIVSCADDASAQQCLNAFDAAMVEVRSSIALAYFREEVGRYIQNLPATHAAVSAFLRSIHYQDRARSSCLQGLECSVSQDASDCLLKIQMVISDYDETLEEHSSGNGEQAAFLRFLSEIVYPDAGNVDVSTDVSIRVQEAIGRLNMDLIQQKYPIELIAASQHVLAPQQ
jgi:hypothetical protein